ncbi:MarR family transcriptional regulator [Mycolicibacterium novocastrense]|uniref:Transcriptional regulator n=1 Tax=Mycolicibacterium novocastrense TaxID=59813 RepID=A0AAW5SKA4_MYCNV|nr:MarR family transcriptional regulator [Mycolicibacterium novocastrense]MCV7024416.1 MarR family transcriptional regulator [Mycolicibacterium novocastrense]GAT12925.1 transcriptional regulator [Mycolicibacterium novocastrense]
MRQLVDEPLGYLLYRLVAVLRPHLAAELSPLGISVPEFVCMRMLSMTPGLTSADMARGTNVSAQAMNQVLNGLEERGVVTRPRPTSAGKAMPAKLTRQGQALLKQAESAAQLADQRALSGLAPAKQRRLKQLLVEVADTAAQVSPSRRSTSARQ